MYLVYVETLSIPKLSKHSVISSTYVHNPARLYNAVFLTFCSGYIRHYKSMIIFL